MAGDSRVTSIKSILRSLYISKLTLERTFPFQITSRVLEADAITATDNWCNMFRGPELWTLSVHRHRRTLHRKDMGKADVIKEWFKKQFTYPEDEPLHRLAGDPRPLRTPNQIDSATST